MSEYPITYCRFAIRTAVTWRLVAGLLRRDGGRANLRVLEMHPGGGQYDCISLFATGRAELGVYQASHQHERCTHLCSFNQQSQHLHLHRRLDGSAIDCDPETDLGWPGGDYVHACLAAEDFSVVVEQIEALLGLPDTSGVAVPTTAPVVVFRLIAALLERRCLAEDALDIRMGWLDTSGCGGGLRENLWRVPGIMAAAPSSGARSDPHLMDYAAEHWLLYRRGNRRRPSLLGVLRTDGGLTTSRQPERRVDLMAAYGARGRDLASLAAEVELMLMV